MRAITFAKIVHMYDSMVKIFLSNRFQIAFLLIVFFAYHQIMQLAGFVYPFPWSDEEGYVWPAISFAKSNTLFTPVLNPLRDTFWIPPGLHILTGLIYKIIPFTFGLARGLSELFLLGGMFAFFFLVKKHVNSLVALIFCTLFLFNAEFLVTGNIARFEALIFLVSVSGYLLYDRSYRLMGLSLASLAPLIHPNGVNFFGALCAYSVIETFIRWRKGETPLSLGSRWHLTLPVFAIACWMSYAVYIGANWAAFSNDMGLQFQWKRELYFPQWNNLRTLSYLLTAVAGIFTLARWKPGTGILIALLIASASIFRIAQVMWYLVFDRFAYLICTLVWFEIGRVALFEKAVLPRFKIPAPAYGVIAVLLLLSGNLARKNIALPFVSLRSIEWCDMSFNDNWPITQEEISEVGKFLKTLERADGTPVSVEFNTSTFFFADYFTDKVYGWVPLFHKVKQDYFIGVLPRSRMDIHFNHTTFKKVAQYLDERNLTAKYQFYVSKEGNRWFHFPRDFWLKEIKDLTRRSQ